MKSRLSSDLYGLFVWIFFIVILYFLAPLTPLSFWHRLSFAWRSFIELNVATLLLYGFDKMSAQVRLQRIPERILYVATFLGGSIGALIAMNVFRHKTRKTSFQLVIAVLILIQLAIVLYA